MSHEAPGLVHAVWLFPLLVLVLMLGGWLVTVTLDWLRDAEGEAMSEYRWT